MNYHISGRLAKRIATNYKTQMGTTLLRIAPIHIQVTEVTFRARLRLLRPTSLNSFEFISALYRLALSFTTILLGSSLGNRAYLPERSVCQCIKFYPYGFPFSNQHFGVTSFVLCSFAAETLVSLLPACRPNLERTSGFSFG